MGVLFNVIWRYPNELHDQHQDFPLAPHKVKISYKKLSSYAKRICDKYGLKSSVGAEKLMATFLPKEQYVLHFWNFQLYLKLGMKVKKNL